MFTPFDLSGRGAVITGGNGGIGLGMARALLAAGAKVAMFGRTFRELYSLRLGAGRRRDEGKDE